MKNVNEMTVQELKDFVGNIYDVCVELMRRTGYYSKFKAAEGDFDDILGAVRVADAIIDYDEAMVMSCITDLWHESAIDASGMDEDEYYENSEVPLWERENFKWNKNTEEWEFIE